MSEKIKQTDIVMNHMKRFGSITSIEAFSDYGITRLASVIFDLREEGNVIRTSIETGKTRMGGTAQYARYTLEAEAQA